MNTPVHRPPLNQSLKPMNQGLLERWPGTQLSAVVVWRDVCLTLHNIYLLKVEPYFYAVHCTFTNFHFDLNSVHLSYKKCFELAVFLRKKDFKQTNHTYQNFGQTFLNRHSVQRPLQIPSPTLIHQLNGLLGDVFL